MKIPSHILDQIIAKNDIVNVVSEYVKIEKRGKNYFGLCPFHSEKTPSFSVSPEKQIFHCFSCGEGGNVLHFMSKIDNLSQTEAIKKLAYKVNIKLDEFIDYNKDDEFLRYYELNKFVSEYYQFTLLNTVEGKIAIEYLNKRNISEETIKRFKIGLAPDSVDSLYQALKSNNFTDIAILELGHVNKSNDRYYDKFKSRIMFPISDEMGNIVGFSGRLYIQDNKNEPKYINTQETPIFKKSNILYNLDQAKKFIKQNNKVYLFEGFMDVIASVNSHLLESVASMGTALTDSHVQILKKYTNNFIICYDGDHAGIEATKRAIEILNKHMVNTSVIQLPEGLDPDEYVKKYGTDKYIEFVNNMVKSLKEYYYQEFYKNVNINNISSIENFKKAVFRMIQLSSPTEKELFINKLSNDIGVSVSTLNFDYNKFPKAINKYHPSDDDIVNQEIIYKKIEKTRPAAKKLLEAHEIIIYMCILDRKNCVLIANDQSISIPDPMFRKLFYHINDYYNLYEVFDLDVFQKNYVNHDESLQNFFNEVYLKYTNQKIENYTDVSLKQCIAVIKTELIALYVKKLKNQIKLTSDENEALMLYQKIIDQYKIIKATK
ncbi:MAG: dnaG [Haloplasmataceae bacterium]|nr:dnaG [Haloplasmataceae bacterium]